MSDRQKLLLKFERRQERERELGAKIRALPDRRYGVILADPEWKWVPYNDISGGSRAAANHYPVSEISVIAARDIAAISAPDSLLALWAIPSMIGAALDVMSGWGFTYKSQMVWVKHALGTGYWFRFKHEVLLIGTRGKFVAPALGTQLPSVLFAKRRAHSQKPDQVADMIDDLWPNLPKIELNRRGPARPGWDAWGNEVEQ